MKDFKELVELIKENSAKYARDSKIKTFKEYKDDYIARIENPIIISRFMKNLFAGKTVDEYSRFLQAYLAQSEEDGVETAFFKQLKNDSINNAALKDIITNKINEYSNANLNHNISLTQNILDEVEKQGLITEFATGIADKVSKDLISKYNNMEKDEDIEEFSNEVQEFGFNPDKASQDISLENTTFFNSEDSITEEHQYQDKINNIIKSLDENKDKEYIEVLKDTSKILSLGRRKYVDPSSVFAENYGKLIDANSKEIDRKLIKQENCDEILIQKVYPVFKQNVSIDTKGNFINNIATEKIGLNEKEIEDISKIIDGIEKANLNSEELDNEAKELDSSQFALTKLQTIRRKLENEIKKNEIKKEDIITLNKQYRQAEEECDNLIKMIDDTSLPDETIGNNASSRSYDVPKKYRNDVVNVSKLNVLNSFVKLCKEQNFDAKEYVKDPIKGIAIWMENRINNDPIVRNYNDKKDIKEFLNYIQDARDNDESSISMMKINKSVSEIGKVNNAIKCFIHDEKTRDKFEFYSGIIYSNLIEANVIKVGGLLSGDMLEEYFLSNRILTCGEVSIQDCYKEEGNWIDFNSMSLNKTTKVSDYIHNEANKFKIINSTIKTLEFIDEYNEDDYLSPIDKQQVVNGLKKAANVYLNTNVKKDEVLTDVLDKLQRGKKLSRTDKKNVELDQAFSETYKGKLDNNNVVDSVNRLLDIKNEYKSRSIFAKIFYSSVRRQSRMIDSFEQKLINDGIAKADLKSLYEASEEEKAVIYNRMKNSINLNNQINQINNENVLEDGEKVNIILDNKVEKVSKFDLGNDGKEISLEEKKIEINNKN